MRLARVWKGLGHEPGNRPGMGTHPLTSHTPSPYASSAARPEVPEEARDQPPAIHGTARGGIQGAQGARSQGRTGQI